MPNYLAEYYQKMKSAGVRLKHQYIVSIPRLGDDFKFFATSAQLPGRSLQDAEIAFHGVKFKIPTVTEFEQTMDLNIRADMGNEIRTNIEIWMNDHSNLAMGGGGKKRIPDEVFRVDLLDETLANSYLNGDETVKTGICNQIARGQKSVNLRHSCLGSVLRSYTLEGVFPGNNQGMDLDTTAPDVAEFVLTINYQYWYETGKNPLS